MSKVPHHPALQSPFTLFFRWHGTWRRPSRRKTSIAGAGAGGKASSIGTCYFMHGLCTVADSGIHYLVPDQSSSSEPITIGDVSLPNSSPHLQLQAARGTRQWTASSIASFIVTPSIPPLTTTTHRFISANQRRQIPQYQGPPFRVIRKVLRHRLGFAQRLADSIGHRFQAIPSTPLRPSLTPHNPPWITVRKPGVV